SQYQLFLTGHLSADVAATALRSASLQYTVLAAATTARQFLFVITGVMAAYPDGQRQLAQRMVELFVEALLNLCLRIVDLDCTNVALSAVHQIAAALGWQHG